MKMKIAFFSIVPLRYYKEATTLTILNLAQNLQQQGHDVKIITEKAEGLPKFQEVNGVKIYRLYNKGKIFSFTKALNKIEEKENIKFDVVHCHSATPLFALSGLLAKLSRPKIKLFHSLKSYTRSKWHYYFSFLLNLTDGIFLPTKKLASELKLVKKNKISIIHSPINLGKFVPQNKETLKQKYEYKNQKIVFYYGSFHEHKGVDNLLHAIPELISLIKQESKQK